MKGASWCIAAALAVGATARGVQAEAQPLSRARVGEWVEYHLGGGGRGGYLRLSVVGEERDDRGRDAVWLEIEVADHPSFEAPLARMAVLASRSAGLTEEGISRVVLAPGAERPAEVARSALASLWPSRGLPRPAPPGGGQGVEVGRPRVISTPAGPVRATPVEVRAEGILLQRFWSSAEVPLIGLARIEAPQAGQSLDLQGFGTAASRRMPLPGPEPGSIRTEGPEEPRR